MAHEKLKALAVFATIFAIVGGVSWALASAQQPTSQQDDQPKTMPKLMTHEQIRDEVVAFIGTKHPETLQFMSNIVWAGGRVETNLLGSETYSYQGNGWNVTIKYPVVANPVYEIAIEYSSTCNGPSIPHHVSWQGTWQSGCLTETSYVFAQ
jgi:hypothetical protein